MTESSSLGIEGSLSPGVMVLKTEMNRYLGIWCKFILYHSLLFLLSVVIQGENRYHYSETGFLCIHVVTAKTKNGGTHKE